VTRITDGVEVEYTRLDGAVRIESFDYVLAATGRRPKRGWPRPRDPRARARRRGCAAIRSTHPARGRHQPLHRGDASNFIPLLHEAADEGASRARTRRGLPDVEPGMRRTPLAVVFTDPQIAIVGGGYDKLVPGTFEAGEVSFEDQGRSRVMRRNRGHLRVYADGPPGASSGPRWPGRPPSISGTCSRGRQRTRMTVASMLEMPFYHPWSRKGSGRRSGTSTRSSDRPGPSPRRRRPGNSPGAPSCRWK